MPLKRPLPVALPSPTTRTELQDGVEAYPRGPVLCTIAKWPRKPLATAPSRTDLRPGVEAFRGLDDRWYAFTKGHRMTRGQLKDQRTVLLRAVETLYARGVTGPALLPALMSMGFHLPCRVCVLPMDIENGTVLIGSSRSKGRLTLPTRSVRAGQTLAEAAADVLVDEVPEWDFVGGDPARARHVFRHLLTGHSQAVSASFSTVLGCIVFCCRLVVKREGTQPKPASSKWSGNQLMWMRMDLLEKVLLGHISVSRETLRAPDDIHIAKGPSPTLASLLRSHLYME